MVFGMPTYAGRVPNKALPFLKTLFVGGGAPAVALVTFGNRSYDSSLTELNEELTAAGFRVFAAGAFARPHAFANIGHEHPTKEDNNLLETLLGVAEVKIGQEDFGSITIKDGAPVGPYYIPLGEDGEPAKFLKAKPLTDLKMRPLRQMRRRMPHGSHQQGQYGRGTGNVHQMPGLHRLLPYTREILPR